MKARVLRGSKDLIARARQAGHTRIVCAITPTRRIRLSEAFHRKLGFTVVGSAMLSGGTIVAHQELRLAD